MKKIISLLLVVSLTAAIAIGGTLAYLTDRDSEANVFTVGNVEIDLNEDFEQGAELIPGVKIEKEPTITNTGVNDAWVWAQIAIPSNLDNIEDASKNAVHFNMSKDSLTYWSWTDDADNWLVEKEVEIDGIEYNVYTVLYKNALKPGETTEEPVIYQVYMDYHIDIDPEGNWYHVLNGDVEGPYWNSDTNGNPIIYVSAYAMQTDGFDSALAAYKAYNTQWTTTEGTNNGLEWAAAPTLVATADELSDALAVGGNVVLTTDITLTDTVNIEVASQIDLNGHNLTVSRLEAKADTEISNGTLSHGESTYPAVSVSAGTLTMENVDIVSENYCNIITSGTESAAEYVGLEIWSGSCVLNDCTITVKADVKRFSNSVIGVGIYSGEFTMNGGSITIDNIGSTRFNYESALFATTNDDKVITLNNVTITQTDDTYYMYAWGGNTTVNTTDANGSWNGKVDTNNDAGTYTINYIG